MPSFDVRVCEARHLPKTPGVLADSDPLAYVVLRAGDVRVSTVKADRATCFPQWEQAFTLTVPSLATSPLEVAVMDAATGGVLTSERCLGKVRINLDAVHFVSGLVHDAWYALPGSEAALRLRLLPRDFGALVATAAPLAASLAPMPLADASLAAGVSAVGTPVFAPPVQALGPAPLGYAGVRPQPASQPPLGYIA